MASQKPLTQLKSYGEELKRYCVDLYAKGFFPKSIGEEATSKFCVPVKGYQVCRWAKKHGLPMIHHPRRFRTNPQRLCPLCNYLGRVNPSGETKDKTQRYTCPRCGTSFTDKGTCGTGKYSDEIRSIAVNLYVSDDKSTFKSVATTINQYYSFSPPLAANTVNSWITSRGLQHSREQKMKNRVYWRTKKYPKYMVDRKANY